MRATDTTHVFFIVASRHCVPILADEIYGDMVSTTTHQHCVQVKQQTNNETHFSSFDGICPGSEWWVENPTSAQWGLRALCGE